MKFNFKKTFLSIFFIFIIIFVAISYISAGVLQQRILSPFGHEIANDKTTYNSHKRNKMTETIIDNSYAEMNEYKDIVDEPFCRIGGMYKIEVYNDARPGHKPTNKTYNLYYCKTTSDIIKNINIPSSWGGNTNLLLYCNDGANIKSQKYNFDFITSKANTYKTCILKNLDLERNNTIIYGYDVGNGIVDNFEDYFYNFETKDGRVLQDLEYNKTLELGSTITNERIAGGLVRVPYIETFRTEIDSETGQSYEVSNGFIPMELPDAVIWAQTNINSKISNLDFKKNFPTKGCLDNGQADEGEHGGTSLSCSEYVFTSESYTEYYSLGEVTWPVGTFKFNDKNSGESYVFNYNSNSKFYSLSSTSENLMIPLSTIFTNYASIGLSRVSIFKKINGKLIYGYEQNGRQRFQGEEHFKDDLKPVYIISIDNNFNFYDQEDCLNFLGVYNPSDLGNSDFNDKIICYDHMIEIISENMDDNQNPDRAFHFFKNIILNLK